MRSEWARAMGLLSVAVACAAGCGRKAQEAKPLASRPQATSVPLPEWAPESPSPEFLRAATVLKPIPAEVREVVRSVAGSDVISVLGRYEKTYPSAWEFFGTLSEREVERFRASGVVRVPVRSMTRPQRRALDAYFDAWREAMAGQQQLGGDFPGDWLVLLYKNGAKKDLSNVDAGFARDGTDLGGVNMQFWVRRSDGSTVAPSSTIASM